VKTEYVVIGIALVSLYFVYKSYQAVQNVAGPNSTAGEIQTGINDVENSIANVWHNITGAFSGGNGSVGPGEGNTPTPTPENNGGIQSSAGYGF
jgi:hypothetical protein